MAPKGNSVTGMIGNKSGGSKVGAGIGAAIGGLVSGGSSARRNERMLRATSEVRINEANVQAGIDTDRIKLGHENDLQKAREAHAQHMEQVAQIASLNSAIESAHTLTGQRVVTRAPQPAPAAPAAPAAEPTLPAGTAGADDSPAGTSEVSSKPTGRIVTSGTIKKNVKLPKDTKGMTPAQIKKGLKAKKK